MCSAKIRASFFAPFSCKRLQFDTIRHTERYYKC